MQHHTHYLELHGFDRTIEVSPSEHNRLNHRLLFPGITKEDLRLISTAAHSRSEKGKANGVRSRAQVQSISFAESFGLRTIFEERISYNVSSGSVYYAAYFRATWGYKLPVKNLWSCVVNKEFKLELNIKLESMMNEEGTVYKVAEVAKILKVSEGTVHTLLQEDSLKGFRIKRQWRVKSESLEEFMSRGDEE